MIPEFMRFYDYKAKDVLDEYAVRFFSLLNAMYRIQASDRLYDIATVGAGMGGESKALIADLEKQAGGSHAIVQEVRRIKNG